MRIMNEEEILRLFSYLGIYWSLHHYVCVRNIIICGQQSEAEVSSDIGCPLHGHVMALKMHK